MKGRSGTRQAAIWLFAWAASLIVWLALVDTLATQEVLAGALAAAVAATAVFIVRSQQLVRLRIKARWLVSLWRLPPRMVADTGIVLMAVLGHLVRRRPLNGSYRRVPIRVGSSDPGSVARRAALTAAGSFAPNTIVIRFDRERGTMLVHELVPSPRGRKARS